MALLRPFPALRYDRAVAGPLDDLIAPPYDVIDTAERDRLRAASPFNAVRLELPDPPYEQVGALIADWVARGALRRSERPGIVAWLQTFSLPDGTTHERRVILATIRAEPYATRVVRPHERTHAGPKEDRLRLLYGAGHQVSPVYGLYPDPEGAVWSTAAPAGPADATFRGGDGTHHQVWWIDDETVGAAVTAAMAERWILIADGHHRYETAVRFAEERHAAGAGDGPHDFVMMGLTAIEDPGLVVLPTHRVLTAAPDDLTTGFTVQPVADLDELRDRLAQTPPDAPAFGLVTPDGARILTCDPIDDPSPAAQLDVAVLERMVFMRAFGRDQAQLAHDGVLTYVKDAADAWHLGTSAQAAAAFILREMPKAAITAVAQAGETMPQKSTYFFPKLPTGIAFHPLS